LKERDTYDVCTTSNSFPSNDGFSRHFPVQYIDSGEPQRSMGPLYHDSLFSISVEIESDLFDLVVIGDIFVRSKVPGDDDTGDERT
jgi:hypothetical protein